MNHFTCIMIDLEDQISKWYLNLSKLLISIRSSRSTLLFEDSQPHVDVYLFTVVLRSLDVFISQTLQINIYMTSC